MISFKSVFEAVFGTPRREARFHHVGDIGFDASGVLVELIGNLVVIVHGSNGFGAGIRGWNTCLTCRRVAKRLIGHVQRREGLSSCIVCG